MPAPKPTHFERLLQRLHHLSLWQRGLIALALLALPYALAWLIYAAMGSARFTALLHRFVLHQDPLTLRPSRRWAVRVSSWR